MAQDSGSQLTFCVFSFNRGQFLRNCIESIETCAPGSAIRVVDDGSDDPETCAELDRIATRHTLLQPRLSSSHHLGGLYGNMQAAYEHCQDCSLICYLQDDTQLVRPVSATDLERIHGHFEQSPELGFLTPCFIKGMNRERGVRYRFDPARRLYFREPDQSSAGHHFSALLVTRPDRLRAAGWRFLQSEPANNRQARELFGPLGYLFSPFAMWLPDVPAYRGKKKTLGLKLAERKRAWGYHPFRIMAQSEVAALDSRDPARLPYAEDFLDCGPGCPPKPWDYSPLAGAGWLKTLNQIELGLRGLLRR